MRVLLLSTEFPPGPGGIGTHAHRLAECFAARGWDVLVLCRQDYASGESIAAFNASQAFEVVHLRPTSLMVQDGAYRWGVASRRISRQRPDLLFTTGQRMLWLGAALSVRHRIPCLAVAHGSEFGPRPHWKRVLTRRSLEQAATVVCVSEFTRRRMRQAGIEPRRDVVIPNGADPCACLPLPEEQVASWRHRLGLNGSKIIVTVGHVSEWKGQDIVIRALPQVLRSIPNLLYLAAGLPTKEPEFTALARDLGVDSHVRFLGRVDSEMLTGLLNCCDVFAMTSRLTNTGDCEGYGIAVVEAALCGKPSVVSADSGLSEAIVDGQTGIAVPNEDPGTTATALTRLLQDDTLRQTMGENARQRALSQQTWEQTAEAYTSLMTATVGGCVPSSKD